MAVEPGQRGESSAFDLDYRDAQVRGVQDELLERQAALRDDEQADGLAVGDEGLFDGVASGDDFLVLSQEVARRRRGGRSRPAGLSGLSGTEWAPIGIAARTGPVVGAARRTWGPAGRGEGLRRRRGFVRLEAGCIGRVNARRLGRFERLRGRHGFGRPEAGYLGRQVNEVVVGGLGSGRALSARLVRALPEAETAPLGTEAILAWAAEPAGAWTTGARAAEPAGAWAGEAPFTTRAVEASRARARAASTRAPKATVWMRAVKPALRSWAGRARAAESTAGARAALARAGVPKGARSPRSPGLPFSRRGVTLRGLGVAIERRGVEIVGARATRARAAEATVTTRAARARAAEATAGARAARARAGVPKGARARKAAVTTRAAGARAAESTAGARAAWARAE